MTTQDLHKNFKLDRGIINTIVARLMTHHLGKLKTGQRQIESRIHGHSFANDRFGARQPFRIAVRGLAQTVRNSLILAALFGRCVARGRVDALCLAPKAVSARLHCPDGNGG